MRNNISLPGAGVGMPMHQRYLTFPIRYAVRSKLGRHLAFRKQDALRLELGDACNAVPNSKAGGRPWLIN